MRTSNYTAYLQGIAALMGIPSSRLTQFKEALKVHFDSAIQEAWTKTNWIDLCPYGEARFVGNSLTYPNDLTNSAWTDTALTVTAESLRNPLDGRTTASKLMETAASSAHSVEQSVAFTPGTSYSVFAFLRANGRTDAYLEVNDGVDTFTVFYDLSDGSVTSSTAGVSTTNISLQPNGFYLCQFTFTSDVAAGDGTLTFGLSTDGSTTSYAGDTTKGMYAWGLNVVRTSNNDQADFLIPFEQGGEETIETLFSCWPSNPNAGNYPTELPYELTPDGIQLISTNTYDTYYVQGVAQTSVNGYPPANPVYVYYRKESPSYRGADFDATATYAADEQVYFEDSDGVGNFWKCLSSTSAGEDPEDTPAKWELIEIPTCLLGYATVQAYGDYLIGDGQHEKAGAMYGLAQQKLDDEFDRSERQARHRLKTTFTTHTSTARR